MPLIPLSDIVLDAEDRLRDKSEYGDLAGLAKRIAQYGQWYDIIIRPPREDELEFAGDRPWVVEDGGRRFVAITGLHRAGVTIPNCPPGMINAKTEEEKTELDSLMVEYYTNDDRKGFTWQEKGEFVRRVHALKKKENPDWTEQMTADSLDMTQGTVNKYLALTKDEEIYNDPRVQKADSFNTAFKQVGILREQKQRMKEAQFTQKQIEREAQKKGVDVAEVEHDKRLRLDIMAHSIYQNKDGREWIKQYPDEIFDWFHWDPPYGGDQDGGAFTAHERIDDSREYARGLILDMLPEIHRTLKDGRWFACWCHPANTSELRKMLQGHELSADKDFTPFCLNCYKPWNELDTMKRCPKSDYGFWVNHYPYIWVKAGIGATGHDIKRFSWHHYETFLLAAKWEEREPILTLNNRSNVLVHPPVDKGERRHVMHKPKGVLIDILERISIAGELGADPSAGSASIVEAAIESSRRITANELKESIWADGIPSVKAAFSRMGITDLREIPRATRPEPA